MGIIINQSIRNAVISYLGIIIGFISTVQLFPNILGAEEFGLTRTLLAIMFVGSQIISIGIPNTIIKQFPYLIQHTENTRGLFLLFIIPVVFVFLLLSIFILLFQDFVVNIYEDSPLLGLYYHFIIPLILFSALFAVLSSYISSLLDTVFASFLQDVLQRIVIVISLILVYFGFISFDTFIFIFVGNYGLILLILLIYSFQKNYLNLSLPLELINKPILKRISSYSFYSFFGRITMILVGNIDILMLSAYKGLEQTGIYAIAFYVGTVISVARRSISKISFPLISKDMENNDLKSVSKMYKQTSLNMFLVGFLFYIGVWANMDNLFAMLPEEYAAGGIVILLIGAANLFDMISGTNGQIILSSKYYKHDMLFTSFLVVFSIAMNAFLIPRYGIIGAALATSCSMLVYNIIKLVFVQIKFSMQPFSWKTIGIIVNGVVILILSFQLPYLENIYLDTFIRSTIMAILYLAIIWIFDLSDEFKHTVKKISAKYLKL
ncbi:MAG: polysaccharide biosynthesis C-terminal domain-containing protein [Balneolaceae bacterium]